MVTVPLSAPKAMQSVADQLAVATVDEGVELRRSALINPILFSEPPVVSISRPVR